jgi:stage II sporulation protein D
LYLLFLIKLSYLKEISVLLKKYHYNNVLTISFNNVEKISDLNDLENNCYYNSNFFLVYNNAKESWYLDNKKLKINEIELTSKEGAAIVFDNNEYEGKIIIRKDDEFIYIINSIDIELYVASVVSHEVYAGWNIESLKVAAITARTYALYQMEEANKRKKIFHIKSSIEHQKYNGLNKDVRIYEAVSQTRGKIIAYNDKPILAMYHVCCGGVIPVECVGFDFEKCPYLKRKKKCIGCKDYKNYFWKNKIQQNIFCEKLTNLLSKKVVKIKRIKKNIIAKSGTVRRICLEIEIINKNHKKEIIQVLLNNKDLRKLFNIQLSLYSSCFTVHFNDKLDLEINGKGHGHHIGLCQRGMHGYSKKGLTMEKIIDFYYPNTTIIIV